MNIDTIKEFINTHKDKIHSNIIYCFKDESLKHLKSDLKQGDPSSLYYTELTISSTNITFRNSPIFIYGEYIKLSREMTQTPLKIKGKLKCKKSVSDFTVQIKDFYKCKEVKFNPSGREDIDVRMIKGRPFFLKVVEPTINFFSSKIPLVLYEDIKLINLKQVSKYIKSVDIDKTYKLLVASTSKLVINEYYKIYQKTPLRVLHRRANLVREREIFILNNNGVEINKESKDDVEINNGVQSKDVQSKDDDFYYYDIILRSSAGAYIKEFVHGDLGRTSPSLSSNIHNNNNDDIICDLLELDVLEVEKKEIEPEFIVREIELI